MWEKKGRQNSGPGGTWVTWVTGVEWRLVPKANTVSERPVRKQRAAPSRARLPPRPVVPPSAVPLTLPSSPRGGRPPATPFQCCLRPRRWGIGERVY